MANYQIKRQIRTALESVAKERTHQRGFQSGITKIDEDDWDTLVLNLHSVQLQGNSYRVSLPRHISVNSVNIQHVSGVPIGVVSGTLVGGTAGGVSGATIGAMVGSVAVPVLGTLIGAGVGGVIGSGVGGLVGGVVGDIVGATSGGVGGASFGKGVENYEQNIRIYAEDIFSNLSDVDTDDNTVYATFK